MASDRLASLILLEIASSEEENICSSADTVIISQRKRRAAFVSSYIAAAAGILREKKVRIVDYVDIVLSFYGVDDFKSRFRLSRESFANLITYIGPLIAKQCPQQKIATEKKLLVYLKYIATQLHCQAISDMFGICETTVHDIVYEVSCLISTELLIIWPSGLAVKTIKKVFSEMQGFPGVIGAVDGSHIPIRTKNYSNRNGFPSAILKAVCDHNMKFTDLYCGWPGSVHDARVLRNSSLDQRSEGNMRELFQNDTHLLGDADYPVAPWLLVPFKECYSLTEFQRFYSFKHSSTRMVIERAFWALKGRFRRLKFIDINELKTIVHIVMSCCAIHQLCLDTAEDLQEYILEGTADMEEVRCFDNIMDTSKSGLLKRNAMVELFSNK